MGQWQQIHLHLYYFIIYISDHWDNDSKLLTAFIAIYLRPWKRWTRDFRRNYLTMVAINTSKVRIDEAVWWVVSCAAASTFNPRFPTKRAKIMCNDRYITPVRHVEWLLCLVEASMQWPPLRLATAGIRRRDAAAAARRRWRRRPL